MRFGSSATSFAVYNIIFHILNLLIKLSIVQTFRFYTNYNEVSITHIYLIAITNLLGKIDIIYIRYLQNRTYDNSGYV